MWGPCLDLKRANFGNLKDKRGQQDKPPIPEGYDYSPLPLSPIRNSDFALWENTELYILVFSLTNLLPVSLPLEGSWKYLFNIDARTLKIGMKPPCMPSLRFRENQWDDPCEDHVRTMWGPCVGHKKAKFRQFKEEKWATGHMFCSRRLALLCSTSKPYN